VDKGMWLTIHGMLTLLERTIRLVCSVYNDKTYINIINYLSCGGSWTFE